MPDMILEATGLTKHYRTRSGVVTALNGVELQLERGETLAVVGESGSGKTTLASLILGIEPPTAGELRFEGEPLSARRSLSVRRRIQYVQQNPMTTLNPRRSVFQSIRVPLMTHRIGTSAAQRTRAADLLELVGMSPEALDRFPSALSGGQRQRVAIARALAVEPQLLVLDEPTSALDVSVQAKTLALLIELQQRLGLTYVFISHDLGVVRHLASRVAVMYQGKLVEVCPTDELFQRARHPYSRMLISAIPVVSEEEESAKPSWPWERNMVLDSGARTGACSFAPRCPFAETVCFEREPELAQVPAAERPTARTAPPAAGTTTRNADHVAACHMVTGVIPNRLED